MREGFDQDDIYVMVEDQFQSIAQGFTQHLHKAEYRRLVDQAKKQKASTIRDISRPTDAFTAMRAEALKAKEARKLSVRQKAGLHNMKASAGRANVHGAGDDSDTENDKADDPWVGTSLHGLMTSPRKSQQALVGLHTINSTTRAAAGFAKSELKSPAKKKGLMDVDLSNEPPNPNARDNPIELDEETTSGDEDDLGALPSRPTYVTENEAQVSSNQKISPLHSQPVETIFFNKRGIRECDNQLKGPPIKERPTAAKSKRDLSAEASAGPAPIKKFAWLDDFDDLPNESKTASTPLEKTEAKPIPSKLKARHEVKNQKASQATEIPTFLV
jgi:hypothetical protein